MIYCNLKGGLGNMMFQIAATYALALENNDKCAFKHQTPTLQGLPSRSYLNNVFSNVNFLDASKFGYGPEYIEPAFHFQKLPYMHNLRLKGYFQSEKYFAQHTEDIRSLFGPSEEISQYIREKYPVVREKTIAMHARRGDYLRFPNIHPVCGEKYYYDALESIDNYEDYNIVICSDDPEWCKNTFDESVYVITDEKDWIDMYLMSMCTHNIIANSSFSWWAAWLNMNHEEKIIIAPKRWFGSESPHNIADLMPEEWIVL